MNQRAVSETAALKQLVAQFGSQEEQIRLGGGHAAIERQHAKGRLTARERIARLIDPESQLLELGSVGRRMRCMPIGAARRRRAS